MKIHEKYIRRCLQLAENGLGNTYPNPMVGSVIVHEDRIIGEGWHQKPGESHAEVNAINAVKDQNLLRDATIYVSLEPCSHFGKTPPCSDLIMARGIKKVVIGTVDPFAQVAGRGIKKLMDSGCEVILGVLEKECQDLNKRFFTFHQKKRPYIILKWAESQDGFLSPEATALADRQPIWITNKYSRQLVHKWRAEEQAILVGTNTAVKDNPQLNTRLWKGKTPVRVVLDQHLRIPKDSALFDGKFKTLVLTSKVPDQDLPNVAFEILDFNSSLPSQIYDILYKHDLQSVIVEGGRKTLQTFIGSGYWDETRVFTGLSYFKKGIKSPDLSGVLNSEINFTSDTLKIYRND